MALPDRMESLQGIPEWAHEYYHDTGTGFELQVQTVPKGEDVTGLKRALEAERKLKRDAEAALHTLKQGYGEITPEQARQHAEQLGRLGEKDLLDAEGVEAVIQKRLQTVNDNHTRQAQVWERERLALQTERDQAIAKRKRDRIETAIRAEAARAGVLSRQNANAVDEAVLVGLGIFTDVDERDNPIAKDQDGQVRYGRDGLTPYNVGDWLTDVRPMKAHWFELSSGGNSPGGFANGAPNAVTLTREQARNARVYEEARSRAEKAGQPLMITG